jgi:hypothetical protein
VVAPLTDVLKLGLAIGLFAAIATSVLARAPSEPVPVAELRRLVACSLVLYAVGVLAALTRHPLMAALVYGTGVAVAALAAWLSRGRDQEDPPSRGDEPGDAPPPPGPDGIPRLDWPRFERDFREYAQRRSPSPTR